MIEPRPSLARTACLQPKGYAIGIAAMHRVPVGQLGLPGVVYDQARLETGDAGIADQSVQSAVRIQDFEEHAHPVFLPAYVRMPVAGQPRSAQDGNTRNVTNR